jgi:magnesium transporter
MRSNLHVPAPSSALLRFLKSQSEGLGFFSANPKGFIFDHAAPRVYQRSKSRRLASTTKCLSIAALKPATLHAGFLNLDYLWSRAATCTTQVSPGCRCHRIRIGSLHSDVLHTVQRNASTDGRGWLRRLWGQKQKTTRPLKSDDLPVGSFLEDGGEAPIFNLGRKISPKSANEAKLQCTEFDENGNVVLVNGEVKKSELIAKVC